MKCKYCLNENFNHVVVKENKGTYLGIGIAAFFIMIAIVIYKTFPVIIVASFIPLIISFFFTLIGVTGGLLSAYFLNNTYLYTICSHCGAVVNIEKKSRH